MAGTRHDFPGGADPIESTGAFVEWPHYLGMLADALVRTGHPNEALEQLAHAFAALGSGQTYFYEPELHRLRGYALLATRRASRADEARAAFRRGLELAESLGSPPVRLRLLLGCLELATQDRDIEKLRREIRATVESFQKEDHAPDLLRARRL